MVTYTTQELVELLGSELFGRLALEPMQAQQRKVLLGPLMAVSRRLDEAEASMFEHLANGTAADWKYAYNSIADEGIALWKQWMEEHADDRWTPKGGRLAPVE